MSSVVREIESEHDPHDDPDDRRDDQVAEREMDDHIDGHGRPEDGSRRKDLVARHLVPLL